MSGEPFTLSGDNLPPVMFIVDPKEGLFVRCEDVNIGLDAISSHTATLALRLSMEAEQRGDDNEASQVAHNGVLAVKSVQRAGSILQGLFLEASVQAS